MTFSPESEEILWISADESNELADVSWTVSAVEWYDELLSGGRSEDESEKNSDIEESGLPKSSECCDV